MPDSLWLLVAELPLEIESYELEPHQLAVSDRFTRHTTVVRLGGNGETGVGEDVTYDADNHIALQEAGPVHSLAGSHTLASFAELIGSLELFPDEPGQPAYRDYRRWAFESAALDLALRQGRLSLAEALGREPRPMSFVMSMGLGDEPTAEPVVRRLEAYPSLRFKLDATSAWPPGLFAELAATGAIDSIDLKGQYKGTVVDQAPDPELYRRVAESFPRAWIEDPALTPETDPVLEPHRDRITWDAIIHSMADVDALPFAPKMVNIKPSRLGSLARLSEAYEECAARGIAMYGGGQWELAVGRGQAQYLASLFHPDGPNDLAPIAYSEDPVPAGLPASPLPPRIAPSGFRWE